MDFQKDVVVVFIIRYVIRVYGPKYHLLLQLSSFYLIFQCFT